jgi:chromosome segregation ATPase
MNSFIELFEYQLQKYSNLNKSLKLLKIIKDSLKIININSNLIKRVNTLIQSVLNIINYNSLIKKREILEKQKKKSEFKQISGDLTAKTDLLNKLNESLKKNKKKLKYTKEDFQYLQNQRNQILSNMNNYKEKIRELNKNKKDCFTQINRITREMSYPDQKNKNDDLSFGINDTKSYSKAEAIKSLQRQAKEYQYEINQLNKKLNELKLKLDHINPSYQTIEADYNSLLNSIKKDEERLNKITKELEDKLNRNEEWKEFEISAYDSLKSKKDIENEIKEISNELNLLNGKITYLDHEHPKNLSEVIKELTEINEHFNKNIKDMSMPYENDEIIESIENFRKVENLYSELEDLVNKFLIEINLETKFQIAISEDFNNFFLKTSFIRSNKENIIFEELTTPEKIYFVMIFYISIKLILQTKNIIFSNLFVPSEYNKRGSIYRTISKILPIFEQEKRLKNFNLIFLISNLEMKKKIENIKIIQINEN